MAELSCKPEVHVVVQKARPSSIKRRTPVKKSTKRPKIKRSDTDMVESSSEEEYFDASFCDNHLSVSADESVASRVSIRRKTVPFEPGKLTPPLSRKRNKSRKRHSTAPDFGKREAIQKIQDETKLVVIEYLRNVPEDELLARNRNVGKPKTILFGEKLVWGTRQRSDSDLRRSASDVGAYRDEVRRKLQSMAVPLKRMRSVSPSLLRDIEKFDKKELRKEKGSSALYLPISRITAADRQESVASPETRAVQKLEWISSQILTDFPKLLAEPINELLTPFDKGTELTYDAFAEIARQSFSKQISRLSGRGAVWSRVALTFYLVREVVLLERVNDTQLELLVEYASKFVAENMYEWITKDNSLGNLKLKEDVLNATGSFFDSISSDDNDELDGLDASHSHHTNEAPSLRTQITEVVNDWVTYGVAALAVGIGIAYNYFKQ